MVKVKQTGVLIRVNLIVTNQTLAMFHRSQVSIDCTFPTGDKIYSCIAEEPNGPFLQILQKECTDYGVNGMITATVTMSMCNMNTEEDHIFKPNSKTQFKIARTPYTDNFQDGYSLDAYQTIKPGECKTMVQTHEMNACMKPNNVPFSVQMEGNMKESLNVQKSFCYAYTHRKNKIKRFPDNILGDPTFYAAPSPAVVEQSGSCGNEVR